MATKSTPQSSPSSSTRSSSSPTPENPCYPYPVAMYYNPWNAYPMDPYYASNPTSMAMYGMPMHYPMPHMMPPPVSGGMTSPPSAAHASTDSKATLVNTKLSPIKDESSLKPLNLRPDTSPENVRLEQKGNRTNYSRRQVQMLERVFSEKAYPDPEDFERLEKELGIAMKCIKVWFQNKRARSRKRIGGQTTFATVAPTTVQIPPINVLSRTTPERTPYLPLVIAPLQVSTSSSPTTSPITSHSSSGKPEPGYPGKSLSPTDSQPSSKSPAMLQPTKKSPSVLQPVPVPPPMMPSMSYYPGYMSYPMFTYPYMYSQCR